jgi:transposase-like protein
MKVCKTCGEEKNYMMSWETECYSCRKERNKKEIQRQIEDGEITEVDCEDEIYCPYCGLAHEEDYENEAFYIGGEHEFTCGECGKDFSVDTHVSYSYSTRRKD